GCICKGTPINKIINDASVIFENLAGSQFYVIEVFTASHVGVNAFYKSIKEKTFPNPRSTFSVSSLTSNSGTLSWNGDIAATQYLVKSTTNSVTQQKTVASSSSTTISRLGPASEHALVIFTGDANGFESIGKELIFTTKPST